jgi:hypothetical protein
MRLPEGFYVLHQPKYRTPNVFDLHDRGMFEWRPPVTKEYGFRLIANEKLEVQVQYFQLRQRDVVQAGSNRRYNHVVDEVLLDLNQALELSKRQAKEAIDRSDVLEELQKMLAEWRAAFAPLREDGTMDRTDLEKKIAAVIAERRETRRNELVRRNSPWVYPRVARIRPDFEPAMAPPVLDDLHREYRSRGGEDPPEDLLEKILLFNSVCDTDDKELLLKPDGGNWKNKDEIWECWVGFASSADEAERVCGAMETVFIPAGAQ